MSKTLFNIVLNMGERIWLRHDTDSNELSLDVAGCFGDSAVCEHQTSLSASDAAKISNALRVGVQQTVALDCGRSILLLPRPRGAVLLLILEDTSITRILHVGRKQLGRLLLALEHGRAAMCDESLVEEALLDLERAREQLV